MRPSVIKKKLKDGKPALLTQLHLTDASIFEMVSVMGFDGIWMDLEHHGYSLETAGNLIRATRVGSADILARAAKGEFMRIGRLLEMGAQGIMYPRCSDASEAEEVVRWTKFAPLGQRGFDGAGADAFYTGIPMDEYVKDANEETFVVIQLEDPKSVPFVGLKFFEQFPDGFLRTDDVFVVREFLGRVGSESDALYQTHGHEVKQHLKFAWLKRKNFCVSFNDLTRHRFEIVFPKQGIGQGDGQVIDMGGPLGLAKINEPGYFRRPVDCHQKILLVGITVHHRFPQMF